MKFDKAIPILYAKDVSKSIAYFTAQLKFDNKWEWEDPATFGGVVRDEVEIFFCKEDQGHPGTWLSVVVDNVDEYYELIKDSGAKILTTPDSKEWNMREMLVECPDGHIIRFGHNTDSIKSTDVGKYYTNPFMKISFLFLLFPFCLVAQENNHGSTIANTFLTSLSALQKQKTLFAFDDISRYHWHYFPASSQQRNGIAMKDLNANQKVTLNALLQKFLSKEGYNRTRSIMDLEYILQVLQPYNSNRIPENYLVAFYGTPDRNKEWGWKFSGHHLALNFTVINDHIAFAPFFFGADPAIVGQGSKKGFRAIKEEEDLALELINSLTTAQKQKAIFKTRAFADIVTSTSREVTPLKAVGISVSEMSEPQYELLKKLIRSYLSSMPSQIAEVRMKKIAKEDMNSLRFGWAGETERNKPHYYRIQGKTFLIEFDNAENNGNHIHLVWRDFNGDFGADLLKEHYKNSKHHRK